MIFLVKSQSAVLDRKLLRRRCPSPGSRHCIFKPSSCLQSPPTWVINQELILDHFIIIIFEFAVKKLIDQKIKISFFVYVFLFWSVLRQGLITKCVIWAVFCNKCIILFWIYLVFSSKQRALPRWKQYRLGHSLDSITLI